MRAIDILKRGDTTVFRQKRSEMDAILKEYTAGAKCAEVRVKDDPSEKNVAYWKNFMAVLEERLNAKIHNLIPQVLLEKAGVKFK